MKKKNSANLLFTRLFFLLYLAVMAYLLFFSSEYGRTSELGYRSNLVPFLEIKRSLNHPDVVGYRYVLVNIVGNIVAFMPFGYFVCCLSKKKYRFFSALIYTFLFSLTVESIQYISKTGAFDVDDLILNTVGGIFGFFCFCLFWGKNM